MLPRRICQQDYFSKPSSLLQGSSGGGRHPHRILVPSLGGSGSWTPKTEGATSAPGEEVAPVACVKYFLAPEDLPEMSGKASVGVRLGIGLGVTRGQIGGQIGSKIGVRLGIRLGVRLGVRRGAKQKAQDRSGRSSGRELAPMFF